MEIRYALVADHATEDKANKPIIIGVFDQVYTAPDTSPVPLPPFFLVAEFNAHVTEGAEHRLEMRFTDMDGQDLAPRGEMTLKFVPQGPGRPLVARLLAKVGPGLSVPGIGGYAIHLFVDGIRRGEVSLHVVARPQNPGK